MQALFLRKIKQTILDYYVYLDSKENIMIRTVILFLVLISYSRVSASILNCYEEGALRFDYDNISFGETKMALDIKNYKSSITVKINKDHIILSGSYEQKKQRFDKVNENIYLLNNKVTSRKDGEFIGYSSMLRISKDQKTIIKTKLDELSNLFVNSEIYKCKETVNYVLKR